MRTSFGELYLERVHTVLDPSRDLGSFGKSMQILILNSQHIFDMLFVLDVH